MISLDKLFAFVLLMSRKYNIDSSHSESHSMDVLHFANDIYNHEVETFPDLKNKLDVIYTTSVLHDMCDKKYMNPDEGLTRIQDFLSYELKPIDLYYSKRIIETMSYSKVKIDGYPDLNNYQMPYHIVREADLLASYNFDRSIIYNMNKGNSLTQSYLNALELFQKRIFNYNTNKLLISERAMSLSIPLSIKALNRMNNWNNIILKNKL